MNLSIFRYKSRWFLLGVIFVWFGLSCVGLIGYDGARLPYIFFCLSVILSLIDAFYRPSSVGYSCLVVFLSLGFWAKLILHLQLDYPYLEPIGSFDGTSNAWDGVMWVSAVGFLGVCFGKTLCVRLGLWCSSINSLIVKPSVPAWYPLIRKLLWAATITLILTATIANFFLGISQSGPLPRLILPWPLNGLMGWMLAFGLPTLVLTLIGWDQVLGRTQGLYIIILEGALSGISSLSRATYILHTIPALWVLSSGNYLFKMWTRRGFLILALWVFIFLVSHIAVMGFRYSSTAPVQRSEQVGSEQVGSEQVGSEYLVMPSHEYFTNLIQSSSILIVDRWIGLEGVMAVVAHPKKGTDLFWSALQDRRVIGQLDLYTSEIALAAVPKEVLLTSQYASPPGGIAFFYFTGSLWAVFAGMSLLTVILLASERVVLFLTKNSFICTFWSIGFSQIVVSFGLGIAQQVTFYVVSFGALGIIWLLQVWSPRINLARVK
jgi:hypothetical protein